VRSVEADNLDIAATWHSASGAREVAGHDPDGPRKRGLRPSDGVSIGPDRASISRDGASIGEVIFGRPEPVLAPGWRCEKGRFPPQR
jgi:hypothetical protein